MYPVVRALIALYRSTTGFRVLAFGSARNDLGGGFLSVLTDLRGEKHRLYSNRAFPQIKALLCVSVSLARETSGRETVFIVILATMI